MWVGVGGGGVGGWGWGEQIPGRGEGIRGVSGIAGGGWGGVGGHNDGGDGPGIAGSPPIAGWRGDTLGSGGEWGELDPAVGRGGEGGGGEGGGGGGDFRNLPKFIFSENASKVSKIQNRFLLGYEKSR